MKVLYAIIAAAITLLGLLHMATTFRLSSSPVAKVWFFGAGIALTLAGVLNFLNLRYGRAAVGLRAVCAATNLFMLCFAGIAGRVIRASVAEQVVMLAVLTSALVLSVLGRASVSPEATRT